MRRKVSVIFAADVVGFSRLMEADETGTLLRLRALFDEVIKPLISGANGRVVKLMGDGLLAVFDSAVDAVECAAAIQNSVADRESRLARETRAELRIGINLGDIIMQGNDIFGDGVNVAARLEALADPGGVLVSGTAVDLLSGKTGFQFHDIGEQKLKNISRPVRCFRLGSTDDSRQISATGPGGQSVAVLPFDNMSGDADQAYFSDGISEDVITDLSRIPGLFVAARNSSFSFRAQATDVRKIAAALNVKYILEGSVRRSDKRVRITAQLIDGTTGGHVWADRFDRDLSDIFAIQDEITENIVRNIRDALGLDISGNSGDATTKAPNANSDAYDLTLKARHLIYQFERRKNDEAIHLLERAIKLDPDFTKAHGELSIALNTGVTSGWLDDNELARALAEAQECVRLDPGDVMARRALSLSYMWQKNLDAALAEIEVAVALSPSQPDALATRGHILTYDGQLDHAIDDLETALKIDSSASPIWYHFLGHAHYLNGDYEKAVTAFQHRIGVQPQTDISRGLLVCAFAQLGRQDEARQTWAELMAINPDYSPQEKARLLPYRNASMWAAIEDGFRKAGVLT